MGAEWARGGCRAASGRADSRCGAPPGTLLEMAGAPERWSEGGAGGVAYLNPPSMSQAPTLHRGLSTDCCARATRSTTHR